MKHIVMFSGGASSSYLAWLVANEYRRENVILLHTPTFAESPDADRFRNEVAEYIGLPITEQAHGMSLWELIEDQNCLPSFHIPFCTTQLKIKQSRIFFKSLKEPFVVYFGYGADEWRRVQKQQTRFETEGVQSKYLIYERGITNDEIKRIIRDEWKICLPETYRYLQHNNCIPCFKGGKSHFEKVARYYPDEFKKAMELERRIGHTVFKDCTLEEIWEKVQQSKNQICFLEEDDQIPCMCHD